MNAVLSPRPSALTPVIRTLRDTWPNKRQGFIGGSDAAAVLGLSPWATPLELWSEKTGRKEPEPYDRKRERMFARGKKLEPFITEMVVDKLVEEMGLQVELLAVNQHYTDLEHGWMRCEIDFELRVSGSVWIGETEVIFDNEVINADAKSVSGFARKKWGEEDTEDVPIEYASQFMFGLMVTGRRYCLVAALRSFDDVDVYWTVRDEEVIAAMRPRVCEFWFNHVVADVPPDPLNFSDIKYLFATDNGQAREATPEIAEKVAQYDAAKRAAKLHQDAAEILQFELGEFISPFAKLTYEGQDLLTLKGQEDTRLDQKALEQAHPALVAEFKRTKTVRVMRICKPKKGTR